MNHLVITTNGILGACAGAVVLAKHPEAKIQISSAAALPTFLEQLQSETQIPRHIHICGIVLEDPKRVERFLRRLTQCSEVVWYGCESQGLGLKQMQLARVCKVALGEGPSSTHVLVERLHKSKRKAPLSLLLELAEDYCQGVPPTSAEHRLWHNIIIASNEYYFLSGDDHFNYAMMASLAKGLVTNELEALARKYSQRAGKTFGMRGFSPVTKNLRRTIGQLGVLPGPVLIEGATGSGKELVAWGLHVRSERDGAFIAINCAVLGGNPQLAADELFGHVKGAFTGANAPRKGAFEQADKGTLFLDEIGELPLDVQAQLLRVLEESKIVPLGGSAASARNVNVRIVAATHRSLISMVRAGKFREDLYYRLSVFIVDVPPLRDRPEDMRSLLRLALKEPQAAGYDLEMTEDDWAAACAYDWPGNIRQFIHLTRRAAYLGTSLRNIIAHERGRQCTENGAGLACVEKGADATQESRGEEREMEKNPTCTDDKAPMFPMRPADLKPAADIYAEYVKHAYRILGSNVTQTSKALRIAPNTVKKYLG